MLDQKTRDEMNERFTSPSYVEALEDVIDRNELDSDRDAENPEYLRGQLELIADCWAVPGVHTEERIVQIEDDLKLIIDERTASAPNEPAQRLKVLFSPYIVLELGGTMGNLTVEKIDIDWSDTCHGSYVEGGDSPTVGNNTLAENFASEWLDGRVDAIARALPPDGDNAVDPSEPGAPGNDDDRYET